MAYSVVTTVLAAAASHALTDLTTVKLELSLDATDTSYDAWLGMAIGQVSKSIARHTKRVFPPELLQDVFNIQQDPYPYQTPGGFPQLELSRWPLLTVVSVVQTLAQGVTQSLCADKDFRADPATGRLLRLNPFTGVATAWEAVPVTVVYTAGFGVLVRENGAVPDSSPYQVTVSKAEDLSCVQSVSAADGTGFTPVAANPAQGQYAVEAGVFTFNAADAGQALAFVYATLVVPEDLVEICLRLITARFQAEDRDPNLIEDTQPMIGTKRYWFGNAAGQSGPFAPDIQAALDDYRTPTIA